jgi:hypothetical protein
MDIYVFIIVDLDLGCENEARYQTYFRIEEEINLSVYSITSAV